MRIFPFFSICFCLGLSLASCAQKNNKETTSTYPRTSVFDTSTIAVISFDQQGNWPFDNSCKPATLNYNEIYQLDSLLKLCALEYNETLKSDLRENYSIDFNKYKYKRQYVAVLNSQGEKEVWINGFCNTWGNRWKNEVLHVNDGGNCYFNLKINLTTKICFELAVNGYA
jgi:hypothetical protein